MQVKITDRFAIIRIDRGENVISCLKEICRDFHIKAASVSGIGATDDFTCGVFNVRTKEYKEICFTGMYEIISLCGNITAKDDEPYIHIHICASDENGTCVGGHLIQANISVTCEIVLSIIDTEIDRSYDSSIGINLLNM